MNLGTFRQQTTTTYVFGAVLAALACSYVWAYHLAPFDRKFPTPWRVFEFSIQIHLVVVAVSVVLFSLPFCAFRKLDSERVSRRHYYFSALEGAAVQSLIFLSPHVTDRFNPFLVVLFAAPLAASMIFVRFTMHQPVAA